MNALFFLLFSRFLYPGKRWAAADPFGEGGPSVESNCSGSKDGKYELLTAINDAIAEEIKDLMTKSKDKKILGLNAELQSTWIVKELENCPLFLSYEF